MANGAHTKCKGLIDSIPVAFAQTNADIDFLAVDGVLIDVFIGLANLMHAPSMVDLVGRFGDINLRV